MYKQRRLTLAQSSPVCPPYIEVLPLSSFLLCPDIQKKKKKKKNQKQNDT